MSVSAARANLVDALKKLHIRWDAVKLSWDDEARRRFQKECIDPLESKVHAALKSLEHVSELTQVVRRECGDDASW